MRPGDKTEMAVTWMGLSAWANGQSAVKASCGRRNWAACCPKLMWTIRHSCRGVPSRDTRNQFLPLPPRCWLSQPGRCVRKPGWISPCYTTIRRGSSRKREREREREALLFLLCCRIEGEEDRGMSLDFFLKIGPRLTRSRRRRRRSGLKNAGFFNLVNRIFRPTDADADREGDRQIYMRSLRHDVGPVLLRPPFGSRRIQILFGGATLKHCEEDLG